MLRTLLALPFLALGPWLAACGDDADAAKKGTATEETEHGLTETQAAEPLVEIGDTTITVGEFAARLADQSPYLRARYNSPERRREFLDNMIRFELLSAEAVRRGLDELPEVERTGKQVMIQQMMKDLFEENIKLSDITDEAIKRYYEEHEDEFHKPEQVRASHIRIRDRGKAARVLRQLKGSPDDVELFRSLAEQHNEDPDTRDRFGDLRFFSRPGEEGEAGEGEDSAAAEDDGAAGPASSVPEAVREAAFEVDKIGGIFPDLVRSAQGWHIVKLTGRRAALHRSLDEARRPIQNRLWREKREKAVDDFVKGLREEAAVEEDLDLLDHVQIDLPPGGSPAAEIPPSAIEPAAAPDGAPGTEGSTP